MILKFKHNGEKQLKIQFIVLFFSFSVIDILFTEKEETFKRQTYNFELFLQMMIKFWYYLNENWIY